MPIGDKIKETRKNKGFTQVELALKAHISRTYVADIERGRYNPSLDTLNDIAIALNVPLSSLVENTEIRHVISDGELTDLEESLVKLFRQIPKNQQSLVLDLVKAALNSHRSPEQQS